MFYENKIMKIFPKIKFGLNSIWIKKKTMKTLKLAGKFWKFIKWKVITWKFHHYLR